MLLKNLMTIIDGFCLAMADSVPGVSGGTIAYILGFYEKFLDSFVNLPTGTKKQRIQSIRFLSLIGCGWLLGFAISVLVLGVVFQTHIYELCSLFLGFSIFAFPIVILEEKKCLKGHYGNLIFTLLGLGTVAAITLLRPTGNGSQFNLSQLTPFSGIYVFLIALIAVSAMVLPGISGSSLLLIFGLYIPVISGVNSVLHGDFKCLPALVIFGLGVGTGLLTITLFLKAALKKYRSQMVYLILGLLAGSLLAIVMGPATLEEKLPALSLHSFSLLWFFIGGVLLFSLQLLSAKTSAAEAAKAAS